MDEHINKLDAMRNSKIINKFGINPTLKDRDYIIEQSYTDSNKQNNYSKNE